MAYRISVPEYEEISGIYCGLAEECTQALRDFYYNIEENCRRCRYKPMVDFTNLICSFYYGDFRSHLIRQFNSWSDSEYSLDNLTRRIGAGDDAVAVGKKYMNRIESALEAMFTSAGIGEISMDTSEPEIDNNTILRNNEYIQSFLRTTESALDYALRRTQSRAQDNDAFVCIIGIVRTTGESMIESFHQMLTQVNKGEELFDTGSSSSIEPAQSDRGNIIDEQGAINWPFEDIFI